MSSPGAAPEVFGTAREGKSDLGRVAFFAPDRPLPGTVPIVAEEGGLRVGKPGEAGALFYALPADAKDPPTQTTPLYEYRPRQGGRRAYSVTPDLALPGHERKETPLCRVWRRPG